MEYTINPQQYIDKLIEFGKEFDLSYDFKNPKTIQDKIAWLNIYDDNKLKVKCADKILLRDYVKEKIGYDLCIPILKIYNKANEINFDELPDSFVIKCNHGSAMNVIIPDKKVCNQNDIQDLFNDWLNINYAFQYGFESHYYDIKPRILVEQYMKAEYDTFLYDYKFWCFNGIPKFYTINNAFSYGDWMNFYDLNNNELSYTRTEFPNKRKNVHLPIDVNKMIEYAKILSEPFKFVRVDFYEINKKIYLSELTFTPWACRFKYQNENDSIEIGNMLDLGIK